MPPPASADVSAVPPHAVADESAVPPHAVVGVAAIWNAPHDALNMLRYGMRRSRYAAIGMRRTMHWVCCDMECAALSMPRYGMRRTGYAGIWNARHDAIGVLRYRVRRALSNVAAMVEGICIRRFAASSLLSCVFVLLHECLAHCLRTPLFASLFPSLMFPLVCEYPFLPVSSILLCSPPSLFANYPICQSLLFSSPTVCEHPSLPVYPLLFSHIIFPRWLRTPFLVIIFSSRLFPHSLRAL